MNCKPGDIAVIVHTRFLGYPVSVLYAAPVGRDYTLPDGQKAIADWGPDLWVCESLGKLFPVKLKSGRAVKSRAARYVAIEDRWLRPITPPAGTITQSEVSELYAPRAPERVT
jgi:hypothetical protein